MINLTLLAIKSGEYKLFKPNGKAFTTIIVSDVEDGKMFNIGSYKYVFGMNGIIKDMYRGNIHCNHQFHDYADVLDLICEQLNTWKFVIRPK